MIHSVFGPNLNDQSKGSFHVHKEGCGDCKFYGAGKRFGGDEVPPSTTEATTYEEIVEEVYGPDEFNYDPETEIGTYLADFWFAPCCDLKARS